MLPRQSRWYERQVEGLGNDFKRAFYAAIAEAGRQPVLARELQAGFRRVRLRRFPYAVFYRVVDDKIIFLLLFHGAREPRLLRRLLRSREADGDDQPRS